MTILADGSFYLYSSLVVYQTNRSDISTLQINGCHVETTSANRYYPFNNLDELYLDNCYFAEPAGAWWYFATSDSRSSCLVTADGYVHTGPIVIEYGEEPTGMRGDVNGDSEITPADISALINYLLNGSDINMDNADCDLDGNITPADISALINYLLGGNVWPAAIKAPVMQRTPDVVKAPVLRNGPASL